MNIKKGSPAEAFLIGFLIAAVMWIVKCIEVSGHTDLSGYGLLPRDWRHLYGILTMPFLHADWAHLYSNTPPLIVLSALIILNYRSIFVPVNLIVLLLGGFWTWLLGRDDSVHIGASAMIYGYASFLFFAGILSKNYRMMAISMLVVFLYGSLFWGIFPIEEQVSWEGHLCGAAAGCFAAVAYRKRLPQRKKYVWENEEEEDDEDTGDNQNKISPDEFLIRYYYTEANKNNPPNPD